MMLIGCGKMCGSFAGFRFPVMLEEMCMDLGSMMWAMCFVVGIVGVIEWAIDHGQQDAEHRQDRAGKPEHAGILTILEPQSQYSDKEFRNYSER
jgi:hypothetical protein